MKRQERSIVSSELREQILREVNEGGLSTTLLSQKYGLHRTTINVWLREERRIQKEGKKEKVVGGARKIVEDEDDFRNYIIKNEGKSLAYLTANYSKSMHPDTFRKTARRLGIKLNTSNLTRRPFTQEELENVLKLQKEGNTLLAIAIIIDRPYASLVSTVSRYKQDKNNFKSSSQDRIIHLANKHYQTHAIAEYYGLTAVYVYKVLREAWKKQLIQEPPDYPTPKFREYSPSKIVEPKEATGVCWYCEQRSSLGFLTTVNDRLLHHACYTSVTRLQQYRKGLLPDLLDLVVKTKGPLTRDEITVAKLIEENPCLTYRELSSITELAVDSVFYVVKKLIKHNIIKRPLTRVSNNSIKYITLVSL